MNKIEFHWTRKLLAMVKEVLNNENESQFEYYFGFPVNSETIRLDKVINGVGIFEIDYNQLNMIYIDKAELIMFLYRTGVFNIDDAITNRTPVIALDVDGVLADIQSETKKLMPEWDETTYHVPDVDYDDFNYLGLAVKDRPTFKFKYILTSRPKQFIEDTKVWLELNNIEYDMIVNAADKLAVMEALDIDVLVDDNPETFEKVNAGGKVCYLYDCTYNQHINTELRIKTLAALENFI